MKVKREETEEELWKRQEEETDKENNSPTKEEGRQKRSLAEITDEEREKRRTRTPIPICTSRKEREEVLGGGRVMGERQEEYAGESSKKNAYCRETPHPRKQSGGNQDWRAGKRGDLK